MATAGLSTVDANALRRSKYHEADVVVVGAGVFGCAVAFALARQGRSVLLLERWMHEPDRIVGELLQPGGVAALRQLGLGDCLDGIDAVPCYGYDVIYSGVDCIIPYPSLDADGNVCVDYDAAKAADGISNGSATLASSNGHAVHPVPAKRGTRRQGRSFHHGRFIMQLRRACQREPNITVIETEATEAIVGEHGPEVLGVAALTKDPDSADKKRKDYFFGSLTIAADGYASRFRKVHLDGAVPVVRSKFYALELIDCPLPFRGFGHVIIGPAASPVLLYQIGTHETRALIDVPHDLPAASTSAGGVKGYMRNVVMPALPAVVRPSFAAALDALGDRIPRSMPNSWLPARAQRDWAQRGLLVLGDALNMRHPLTGGGMTVAFGDVVLLTDLLSPENVPSLADRPRVARQVAHFYQRRKALTGVINVLAQALYSLFAADDWQLAVLQRGCFRYFKKGVIDVPAGLLGGLIPKPLVLTDHFFRVACLGIWMHMCELVGSVWGLWKAPIALLHAFMILWKACVVFLPVMLTELR